MGYSNDVIISFSKEDFANDAGWLKNFNAHLSAFLKQLLKRDVKVLTSQEMDVATADSAAFICLLSESYLSSENCHNELRTYHSAVSNDESNRIFPIAKSDVNKLSDIPASIAHLEKYNFNEDEVIAGGKDYWLNIVDLANDIVDLINEKTTDTSDKSKVIYLAETSSDQLSNRSQIRREFQRKGYTILPNKPLPNSASEIEDKVIEYLSQSSIAIHIIGSTPGRLVEDTEQTLVDHQIKIAANYSERFENMSSEDYSRLIWMSPDLKLFDDNQKLYIERLKHDKEALIGAEIVQAPIEQLKTIVQTNINKNIFNDEYRKMEKSNSSGSKKIYLIGDQKDQTNLEKLSSWLSDNGFQVLKTGEEETQDNLIKVHRRYLATCDAAIIYYGHENEKWIDTKLHDLIKAPGFGRKKPMEAKAIFTDIEAPIINENLKIDNLTIVESKGDFSPDNLNTFLQKIK